VKDLHAKAERPKQETTVAIADPLRFDENDFETPLTELDKAAEDPIPVASSANASPATGDPCRLARTGILDEERTHCQSLRTVPAGRRCTSVAGRRLGRSFVSSDC
jgi:hypothetical protein